MEPHMLATAELQYDDWVGTAAAENSMLKGALDLHELAGLDHDKWTILAIDVSARSHGAPPRWSVLVYALDREANGVESYEDLRELSTGEGAPVVEIELHDIGLDQIVRTMKALTFQLRSPNHPKLKVVEQADFPAQD